MTALRRSTRMFTLAAAAILAGVSAASAPLDSRWAKSPASATVSGVILPLSLNASRVSSTSPTGLGPSTLNAFYGLHPGGKGQVIMIIASQDYKPAAHDLTIFSKQYGLPVLPSCRPGVALNARPCFAVEQPQGTPPANTDNWTLEDALDIEWAHAEAPEATIVLVEAVDSSQYPPTKGQPVPHLIQAAKWAADNGASEISMSWGVEDITGANFSSYLSYVSHPGVFYTASAGDYGPGLLWPAEAPNVLAVGGTTLEGCSGTTCKAPITEVAWLSSGGGASVKTPEPAFQTAYAGPVYGAKSIAALTGSKRGTPDVSFLADEANGVSIYESLPAPPYGDSGWITVGGTSVGAPVWAAILASGAAAKATALQGPAAIYAGGWRTNLFDVTQDPSACTSSCRAGKGYDLVTGLGSPRNYP